MDQFDPKDALQYDNWDNTDLNRILSEETYYSPSEKDTLLMSSSSSSSPVRSRSADLKRSPGTEDDIYYELNRSTYLKSCLLISNSTYNLADLQWMNSYT